MKYIQTMSHRKRLFIASWIATLPLSAMAANGTPSMYDGMSSVFVPFANLNAKGGLGESPQLNVGLTPGKQHRFTLDTGSTGILASPDIFTPGPGAEVVGNAGEGQLTYSSSGRVNHGTWYQTTVNIYDSDLKAVATANVPVLQVTRITCLPKARDCQATNEPRGVSMMGVGFAREHDHQGQSTPDKNPFLHLISVAAGKGQRIRSGYIFANNGVHLGLTPANTQGFAFIPLGQGAKGECAPATATIEINGVAASGGFLMDTGVDAMFLSPPSGTNLVAGQPVPQGTQVSIYMPRKMPQGTQQPAFYTFKVGDAQNALQPEKVTVVNDATPFVNTGRHFLRGFQYLYDSEGCYVGFKWTQQAKAESGGVMPSK